MSDRPVNFNPGPAILPLSVLEKASRAVLALDGVGLSVLEISHRSKEFEAINADAMARVKRLFQVPDTHDVLFLQGGASGQFAQIPLNFLGKDQVGAYVLSGAWSKKALEEAKRLGNAVSIASSEAQNFCELPSLDGVAVPANAAYVHTTSNNTIYGTQWPTLPEFPGQRHVCDMSSDIFSRPVDGGKFALIYAGAQKNAGPSGVTIVIVEKAWMASAPKTIPTIWRYQTHADNQSLYNTPPTLGVYLVGLTLAWIEEQGGLAAIEKANEAKAKVLYDAIDGSNGFYRGSVTNRAHRSRMNVTFLLPSEELEKKFLKEADALKLVGLKGHRSVGGLRASIYNAMPLAGVEKLVGLMERFRKAN
ncbi:MAG: 3-phosphoserine/phosphohydroxythreonine transaminase [bacterium]